VSYLLAEALQEWSARSSRRWEGRDWSQRWQQQQQQEQQQQQQQQQQSAGCMQEYGGSPDSQAVVRVSSNYCRPTQAPQMQQHQDHVYGWDQQQQQQLVLQPTMGFWGNSRAHSSSSSSSSRRRQAPTLVRAGTSGSSGSSSGDLPAVSAQTAAVARSEVLTRQLASWLLASQMAFESSSNSSSSMGPAPTSHVVQQPPVGGSSSRAAAAGGGSRAVVRISSWSATASAVAAAMTEGVGGPEPLCADATLLSHSLRCLTRGYLDSAGVWLQQQQQQQQDGPQQQRQQQQQPFIRRMVNRLRSRL
jgi:hypothetical protein